MSDTTSTHPVVTVTDGQPTTTSHEVAQYFERDHKNVLKSIHRLLKDAEISGLTFEPATFETIECADEQGKPRPAYRLTRDGFTLLAMGFTGKKAFAFKLAYIDAFNRMERELRTTHLSLWEQRNALERREADSFFWARFGSKCMNERRREKPLIAAQRQQLSRLMQPSLFDFQVERLPC